MSETIFTPHNKDDLRRHYPELLRIKEFEPLTSAELLFTWYYACPVKENKCLNKVEEAIKESGIEEKVDGKTIQKYIAGNFGDKLSVAIERMSRFEPALRNRAKDMINTIFSNFENLVTYDEKDFILTKEGIEIGVDWTGRKSFVDTCATIAKELPSLIKQVEEGFGIKNEEEKRGVKAIDKFHDLKN